MNLVKGQVPTKEIRDRDHRTMRVNMRVGKRYGDGGYEEDEVVSKRDIHNPKRRLRLVVRPGKRTFELDQPLQFYTDPQEGDKTIITAPKRKIRLIMRTGKRDGAHTEHLSQFDDDSTLDTDPYYTNDQNPLSDFKRSSPQFLLNPRVGKLDKTWNVRPVDKRNDPKATDLWFGPRIGRSNDEKLDDVPWNYVILNDNNISKMSAFKPNDVEDQINEEPVD
ncbi:uncharacterized protein LOC143205244 isoform X2 [Rhynchophorus ferrugineus]|uniref:uncharacterized protein LOC143205244 isoform X2 n=1 Tax=Rhynchophorus ferrugineus TaxID=354439 RepID=UPI003FCE834D